MECGPSSVKVGEMLADPPVTGTASSSGLSPSKNWTVPPFAPPLTLADRVTGVPFLALAGPTTVVVVALSASMIRVVARGPAPLLSGPFSASRGVHRVGAQAVMTRVALGRNVRKLRSLFHAPALPPVRTFIAT